MQDKSTRKLNLQLLGPFALSWSNGRQCELTGQKVRALLAILAAQPAKTWQRESLMVLLWPDTAQQASQASLRQTIYRLRRSIAARSGSPDSGLAEPLLITSRNTVQINPAAPLQIDIVRFQTLLKQVQTHQHKVLRDCTVCLQRLETAVNLYKGEFLSDLYLPDSSLFEDWASAIRAEMVQAVLAALQNLGTAYLDLGQFGPAAVVARRQLAIDPLQESAQRLLMLALARDGNKIEALSQFDQFRRQLDAELGVTPSTETIALFERIQEGQLDSTVTPGVRLREYLILEELGSDGYGTFYRALQPALNREVAIKIILPEYAEIPGFVQRMEREARLVAGLEHPHIVPLYDYWRDSSGVYMVMRAMTSDLAQRLAEKPLSMDEILRFLDQVAGALQTVHEEGVVHRDLRPVNILLDEQNNFYLTDFGLAPEPDLAEQPVSGKKIFGTPGYSSPELLKNQPAAAQADIYSLGVILYELLTGVRPFSGSTAEKIVARQLAEPLPPVREKRPDLPAAIEEVLDRATARDPQERYTSSLDLAIAFRRALAESGGRDWGKLLDLSDIPPGQKIHEYEVREKFASGAFSAIYRAFQESVGREVAMKVILPQFAGQPDFLPRWEAEAHIVARLEHPHIVPLYDFWRESGGIFMIMRLLRGGSLRARLNRGPLPLSEILPILQQVAGALQAVHEEGIVHRDLKPGNILLDEHGNAYLTDFGIAKELAVDTQLTVPGTFIGSPAYISPEQLRNAEVTPQTDIYSLGIILFEMLTGRHPYATANLVPLIQQHLNEPLPSLLDEHGDLPAGLDRVLTRATAKHPGARHRDVPRFLEDFEDAVKAHQAGIGFLPISTRPAAPSPQAVPFVARERQLARLDYFLDRALGGDGQIVFVTGGAGRGKTALLEHFTRQALRAHPGLLAAGGTGNATAAAGDPYLPFRELLGMLTADVDARLRAGTIDAEHAARLRAALPKTGAAIVEKGPELLDALVPSRLLLARGERVQPEGAPWLAALGEFIRSTTEQPPVGEGKSLFAHFTAVLQTLSQEFPLILVLDDLQWIDRASAGLLFHISRSLAGYPILLVCAYRREEVALGRDGERHPLEKVLSESKRAAGDIWINLAELQEAEELHFVNTLLDRQPNHYSESFREALFDHTAGHALFTVELLRAMHERGDLRRDEEGYWVESDDLNWEKLPLRIEGVIEERTGRLDEETRALLATAAVEGELFTVEILAHVLDLDLPPLLRMLSRELQGQHYLVREQDEVPIGRQFLTRYRFSHTLIQQYLYAHLSSGEKRMLHERIASAMEQLLGQNWHPYAANLAWQFKQAGLPERALSYWMWLGDQARKGYAHAEAISSYSQAIAVLLQQGHKEQAGRTALKLAHVYTADFQTEKAKETYEQAFALWDPVRSAAAEEGSQLPGATLHLALEAPGSYDPGLIFDDVSTFLAAQLFEGLVRVGQEQTVVPALATRWQVFDGGRRYRFYLHHEAAWNDGSPLTAADFVYAFQRNLHPDTNSPAAQLLYVIQNARQYATGELQDAAQLGISAVDAHTLEITLERPIAYLPHLMAHTVTFPLPKAVIEGAGEDWVTAENIVSNGPYQLEACAEQQIVLTRNPHYRGSYRGNVQRVICPFIHEYEESLQAFGRDELDVVSLANATPETLVQIERSFGDALVSIPRWSTFHISFRCDSPPFNDRRVRQALAHALDRQALTEEGFKGQRLAAMGGFIPHGMPGHSPGIALKYDPQKARALLLRAGYPGAHGFPPVEWLASPGGERVISFIQKAWQDVLGLNLETERLEWEDFMRRLQDNPAQITITGWGADFPDPNSMLRATFHSQEGLNLPHWHNARFDELTDTAENVTEHSWRMALYQEADRILVAEETAVLPLSYDQGRILVKPWVKLPVTPIIAMPLRLVTVAR